MGNENYRKQREREATRDVPKHVNSVSYIDQASRILFPTSFAALNLAYWMFYGASPEDFQWKDPMSVSHWTQNVLVFFLIFLERALSNILISKDFEKVLERKLVLPSIQGAIIVNWLMSEI